MMGMILSVLLRWLGGPVIGTVVMTVLGSGLALGGLAWMRYEARAPYVAQVDELKTVIKRRDETNAADHALAEQEAQRAQELQHELAKASTLAGSCKLSSDDLARLRRIAAGTHK